MAKMDSSKEYYSEESADYFYEKMTTVTGESSSTVSITPSETTSTTTRPQGTAPPTGDQANQALALLGTGATGSTADMEMMSAAAFASILAQKDYESVSQEFNPAKTAWLNYVQQVRFDFEKLVGARYITHENEVVRLCYSIGVTYLNAIQDIRNYYNIRYLYYQTLQYEIGYMVHEIVFKYQITLELFHMVQGKFVRYREFASTTYMFYMYTHIMTQCKDIIHLCNMLNEVEKKYKKEADTAFNDYHVMKGKDGYIYAEGRDPVLEDAKRKRREKKRKLKEQRKEMKKLSKWKKWTPKPTFKSRFPLHYGWSIENW